MDLFKLFGTIAIDNASANGAIDETSGKAKGLASQLESTSGAGSKLGGALASGFSAAGSVVTKVGGAVLSGVAAVAKAGAVVVAAGATAATALTKSAVQGYAEYEQLVGGIETLLGTRGAKSVEEYAEITGQSVEKCAAEFEMLQQAQSVALTNADNAYKTANMSANDYMTTVTGLAAALNQSSASQLDSANLADMAVRDMSDNVNKMGTSMESIENAYMGFSKQNYTMLDNLKLGYGGTKTEMQRLVNDAAKLDKSIKKNDLSFSNIVMAIHAVQNEMGITGTTAAEASSTISGSVATMKAAWSNLVVGIADDNNDLSEDIGNFVESVTVAAGNILPRIKVALGGVGKLITEMTPILSEGISVLTTELAPVIPEVMTSLIPGIAEGVAVLATGFAESLPSIVGALVDSAPAFVDGFVTVFDSCVDALPSVVSALIDSAPVVIDGFGEIFASVAENMPQIMDTLVPAFSEGLSWAFSLIDVNVSAKDIEQTINRLFSGIGSVGENIKGHFGDLKTIVSENISNIGQVLSENGVTIEGFFEGVGGAIDIFADPIKAGIDTAMKGLTTLTDWASKDGSVLNEFLKTMGKESVRASEGLTGYIESLGYVLEGDFEGAGKKFSETTQKAIESSPVLTLLSSIWENYWNPTEGEGTTMVNGKPWYSPWMPGANYESSWTQMQELAQKVFNDNPITPTVDQSWAIELEEQGDATQAGLVSTFSNPISPTIDTSSTTEAQVAVSETSAEVETLDGKTASPKVEVSGAEESKNKISGTANAIADLTAIGTVALKINTTDLNQAVSQSKQAATDIQAAFEFALKTPKVNTTSLDAAVDAASTAVAKISELFSGLSLSIPSIGVSGGVGVEGYASGGVMMKPTAFGLNPNTGKVMVGGEAGAEAIAPIDVLQGYVAQAVASQNAAQTTILERMLDGISELNANMGASMREAVEGMSFSVNNREFGRLVKGVT